MPNKYKREATLRGACDHCGDNAILYVRDKGNICAWCINDIYGSEDYLEYEELVDSFCEERVSFKKKLHNKRGEK